MSSLDGKPRGERVRLLAELLYVHQIDLIRDDGILVCPFGFVQKPSQLGHDVMTYVRTHWEYLRGDALRREGE
jgi:hypothetical protein